MAKYDWSGPHVRALRRHLRLSQVQFGRELGVRQATVSDWEQEVYRPRGASAKVLTLVAERAGFVYEAGGQGAREHSVPGNGHG